MGERGTLFSYSPPRMGYIYWQLGYKEKADTIFNMFIQHCNKIDELDRPGHIARHFFMAQIFAFKGEKAKAYEYLKKVYQRQRMDYFLIGYLKDPMFNSLRNEPEFQQIVRDIEAKYLAEHERVRQWLKENDMM
jgi:hypothetical protein